LLSRPREERRAFSPHGTDSSAQFVLSSVKSWVLAQIVFNDRELETILGSARIRAHLRPVRHAAGRHERSYNDRTVSRKLQLPSTAPSPLVDFAEQQISHFLQSRATFERASRRSLSAILHQGGWLTIRPIRALNLPDSYTGMFLKLRYGAQVLVTGSVDAKVSPTWSTSSEGNDPTNDSPFSARRSSPDEKSFDQPNDLHIHVTPQRTNGWIRLSVHGERRQQKLQSKTELGILYLPLGNAIAACVDGDTPFSESAVYERWFPLLSPLDAAPVEGDGGLSRRPPESEKQDENTFKDYYRPCLQLALIWQPDKELAYDDVDELKDDSSDLPRSRSTLVKHYFNADIAQVSAALIDSDRAFELLSFNVLDFDVRYWITTAKTRLSISYVESVKFLFLPVFC
jgi:hypothetical protein